MINFELKNLKVRIIRAAKLDVKLYEELGSDDRALSQAIVIIVSSSLAAGIGVSIKVGLAGAFASFFASLASWFFWISIIYFIGSKIIRSSGLSVHFGQFLRTVGFAAAPGLIRVLGVIPWLANIVFFVAAVWILAATVVAVKLSFQYPRLRRSAFVCIGAWIAHLIIILIILSLYFRIAGIPAKI